MRLFIARSSLANKTAGISPAVLNTCCAFLCIRSLPAFGGVRHDAEEETSLATEKSRREDCDVSPAVCAAINRVVSPDPTPVGHISSAEL